MPMTSRIASISAESQTDITSVAVGMSTQELDHAEDSRSIAVEKKVISRSFSQVYRMI